MFSPSIYTVSVFQLGLTSALSAYGLILSYQNITRLQQYEKQSEKAAEWSNTAAQRLHKTRSTQTSGTVTVCHPPPSQPWKANVRISVTNEMGCSYYSASSPPRPSSSYLVSRLQKC